VEHAARPVCRRPLLWTQLGITGPVAPLQEGTEASNNTTPLSLLVPSSPYLRRRSAKRVTIIFALGRRWILHTTSFERQTTLSGTPEHGWSLGDFFPGPGWGEGRGLQPDLVSLLIFRWNDKAVVSGLHPVAGHVQVLTGVLMDATQSGVDCSPLK
jgi:hypothetical protein